MLTECRWCAVLDSHGWGVAIEATDSLGRSAAQMHAQSGFTVGEQMLAQSLPDVDSYAGPQPRPSDAQAKHPTEVTGERTADEHHLTQQNQRTRDGACAVRLVVPAGADGAR